eukprot:jgi/Picsp_1/2196/NSC_05660-R1_---NA---
MEEDEGYISRVLDGREVTTGSWAPRSSLRSGSADYRRYVSSEHSMEQGGHGRRHRGSKWRSRNGRVGQGTRGGASQDTRQSGSRRAAGAQDGRQRQGGRGYNHTRVSGRSQRRGRGEIGDAGMQYGNVSGSRQSGTTSAIDSGSETLVEILHRTGDDVFSAGTSFCVAIKAQILMVYGPGRIYSCCCDVLRNSVMARALRLVVREIEEWKSISSQVSNNVNPSTHGQVIRDQSQVQTVFDDMTQHSTNLAALSCICMYFEVPSELVLEFPAELESSGHAGSWFVACVMLLKSISDGLSKSAVLSLTLRLPARLAKSLSSVVTQGLVHVEQAIRSLIEKSADIRNIYFQIRPMPQIDGDPWIQQQVFNIIARLSQAIDMKNEVWEKSKLAFLMVTHPRLGIQSPFNHVPENILAQIIEEVCASQRISIHCA